MILSDLSYIKKNIEAGQRLMALDVSKNNIGLAISDLNLKLAFPMKTIKRKKFNHDVVELKKIIQQENIYALIIGFPYDGDGSCNERTQSIKDFALEFLKNVSMPIFFQDERFSTKFIKENSRRNMKKDIDEQSAAWFLQIFLDKLVNLTMD